MIINGTLNFPAWLPILDGQICSFNVTSCIWKVLLWRPRLSNIIKMCCTLFPLVWFLAKEVFTGQNTHHEHSNLQLQITKTFSRLLRFWSTLQDSVYNCQKLCRTLYILVQNWLKGKNKAMQKCGFVKS